MNIGRSLLMLVFISLVAEKASCQTQSLYFKAWTHPVLKLLERGASGIIAFTHEKEDDYLIPLAVLNKSNSMLYYINTFGSVFDSIGTGPIIMKELLAKRLNAFDFYKYYLSADEFKEIESLRFLIRAKKDIAKYINPGNTYINYSELGAASSSLEQMILLDNIEGTVWQNIALVDLVLKEKPGTGFKEKTNSWDDYDPCKIRSHSGKELDSVEFTSSGRYKSIRRAVLRPATATIYLYDQLGFPVDSFAIKKEKINDLAGEKQDVFALYRNWLEWRLQQAEDEAKKIQPKKQVISAAKSQPGEQARRKMLLDYASYIRQKIRFCIIPDKDMLLINVLNVSKQVMRKKWVAAKKQWEGVAMSPGADPSIHTFTRGNTEYFLTDHRSNVMVTVSDRKLAVDSNHDGTIDYYVADVISATDYAPFGSQLTGRTYRNHGQQQRYGYNGKENDNDIKGEGNQQDYGMRIYDPRLGRFLSVDPLAKEFPELSTYQYASNSPIESIDLDGLEAVSVTVNGVNRTAYGPVTNEEAAKRLGVKVEDLLNRMPPFGGPKPQLEKTTSNDIKLNSLSVSKTSRNILDRIYDREGRSATILANDPGGLTKFGIAKTRAWPDAAKLLGISPSDENLKNLTQAQADEYYLKSRLGPLSINEIKNEKLGYALFDQSVVTPAIINKNLKAAINEISQTNYSLNNSKLTSEQIEKLNSLDQNLLLNKFINKQKEYYNSLSEKLKNRFLKGWENRLDSIKTYKPKK